jgi:tetratricopeptide (TPR) repeat protein/TolB-like protein
MSDFIHEFRERRILPAVGVYAAGSWVLIEILDRLVERYLLSPYITDAAFWGLYSLIPAVILVAWSHGKPGRDKSTVAEKVGVPINIIATIGLLITIFAGKDLGAAANMITLANEEGVQETHYIPNESFRRRMVVFFFDNESGDPELDFLQYGITDLLVQDLKQNPFVLANSPWANYIDGFYSRMRQAGFEDGLGVPKSLMREIADDANRQYFVEGSFKWVANEYVVTARVWETLSLKLRAELTISGWDLYETIDTLSRELQDALDVPQVGDRMAVDLPLSVTYGESQNAFRNYISGLNARLFDNDIEASNRFIDAALREDPGFVLALIAAGINHLESGDLPSAQVAIQKAQELDYRLPARDRAQLKQISYRLSGQNDKLIAYLRMQVKLRDDASSHSTLATMLMVTGELEEAKKEFKASLAKDSLNLGIYLHLSQLERATGNMEAAIGYARKYLAEKPENIEAHMVLGDFLRDIGELDSAEENYLQASLLENQPVQPLLRLAEVALRKGNANSARTLLAQAGDAARTPQDEGLVRQGGYQLESRLGKIHAAIEQLQQQEEFLNQSSSPFGVALAIYGPMVRSYCDLGDNSKAEQALLKGLEIVQPPLDQFLAFSEATLLISRGNLDGAEVALNRGVAIIDQFKFEDLRFQVDLLQGHIKRLRGDHAGSAESFLASRKKIERTVTGGFEFRLLLPIIHAELARSLVLSGDLEMAEHALDEGFRLDPSEPMLWVAKAHFQLASGLPQLAQASVNYALAIWKDADPEYYQFARARELEAKIRIN